MTSFGRSALRPAVSFLALLAMIVAAPVIVTTAALLVGAFLPSIPYLRVPGSVFVSSGGPWSLVAPLLATATIGAARIVRPGRLSAVFFGLGALATLAGGVATARMANAVVSAGAAVQLLSAFSLEPALRSGAADATEEYAQDASGPLTVQIYRPAAAPGTAPSALAPVLVYLHGGGWISGDNTMRAPDMRWFAEQGWLVISVGYALSRKDRPLWNQTIGQVGCALVWTAENSARYGGDASRLSLIGDSAGGNLAINAGYLANKGALGSACGGQPPKVAVVSAMYPAVDPVGFYNNPDGMFGDAARDIVGKYLGGPPERYPERYAAVSSATHISPDAPPTFMIVGENDHLVPPEGAYEFAERAAAAGVEVKLVRFPYGEHTFDYYEGSFGNQIFRRGTRAFLGARGQSP